MKFRNIIDQMGGEIRVPQKPERIVSLVPSQTELLSYLGLENEVVGITKFCVHPSHWYQSKKRIGGTKTLHLDAIAELRPDLLIGNLEENDRQQITALSSLFPVWMSDVRTLRQAFDMIRKVGHLTGKSSEATDLIEKIELQFGKLRQVILRKPDLSVAYFIWRKPYMVAGASTFIHEMLGEAGFRNVFEDKERYPEISLDELKDRSPDLILLSSEPFPFAEKHFQDFLAPCPHVGVHLVDGTYFSWYGSRLLSSASYFLELRQKFAVQSINSIP